MAKVTFDKSLEIGKRGETFILKQVQKTCPLAEIVDRPNYDIYIPELFKTIEVKTDKGSFKSPNIVIEIEYNGKKSGINNMFDLWAQIFYSHTQDSWVYFIVSREKMREYALKEGVVVKGGDYESSKLLKLNKRALEKEFEQDLEKIEETKKDTVQEG